MAKKKKKKAKKNKAGSSNDSHGKSDDIMAMLEERDGDWQEREEPSFGDIPDGKYNAKIDSATVNKAKSSGRLQVSWVIKIAEGDLVNRTIFKHDGLDNPQSMGYFSQGINRLGEDVPESLTEIPAMIEGLVGTFCEITLKTKNDNQNCFFNKAVDDDAIDAGELDEVPEENGDDDPDAGADDDEAEIEVGSNVYGPEFGDDEPAEVTKLTSSGKATITYDSDDTTGKFKVEELTLIEEEETETETEKVGGDDGDGELVLDFTDDDLKKKDIKKIKELAKEHEYKEKDFDTLTEMLFDIAEYCEVKAEEYENAKQVFSAIDDASDD